MTEQISDQAVAASAEGVSVVDQPTSEISGNSCALVGRSGPIEKMAVVLDDLFDGVEVGEQVCFELCEVEQVATEDDDRGAGGLLLGEILGESLVSGEKRSVVLSALLEEVLVGCALEAQTAGVLCLVPFGYETVSERRWEVLIDENLHAGWAAGR